MKTLLLYFSGTGNTLYAARRIAEGLEDARMMPVTQFLKKKDSISGEYPKIGFIFPLYYLSFPEIVMRCIIEISLPDNAYVFAVVTRGFPPMGGVFKHLKKILAQKGSKLNMGIYLDMPNNDLILFAPFSEKKNKSMLKGADDKLPEIITMIRKNETYYSPEPFAFMRPIRHPGFLKRLPETDTNYRVREECNGCGICEKICPVNNITIINKKPQWKCEGLCQECEGCINVCPPGVIEYGKKSRGKSRYHHPEIKPKDLMEQKKPL